MSAKVSSPALTDCTVVGNGIELADDYSWAIFRIYAGSRVIEISGTPRELRRILRSGFEFLRRQKKIDKAS